MPAMVLGIMSTFALTVGAAPMTLAAPNMPATVFEKCTGGHRIACVIDGDTLWIDGTKARIADINAPEISEPKCASEPALGTERLLAVLAGYLRPIRQLMSTGFCVEEAVNPFSLAEQHFVQSFGLLRLISTKCAANKLGVS
jgi:hypothetical protein